MVLPLDVRTDTGINRLVLEPSKPLKLKSKILPVVDPGGYYFKRVVIE